MFFKFQDPWFLILFLIIPYLLWQKKEQLAISYSSLKVLQNIRSMQVSFLSNIPLILRLFTISLFILALARPQEGQKKTEILSMGVDIMLALDTSGSMQALDFIKNEKRETRLAMVKDVVSKLVFVLSNSLPLRMLSISSADNVSYSRSPLAIL